MAHERRIPNYRKMYPTASEEVIAVLRQSERRLQYLEYDIKVERFVLDETKQVAFFIKRKPPVLPGVLKSFSFEYLIQIPPFVRIKMVCQPA